MHMVTSPFHLSWKLMQGAVCVQKTEKTREEEMRQDQQGENHLPGDHVSVP